MCGGKQMCSDMHMNFRIEKYVVTGISVPVANGA
jgi:hypothetical protein